MGKDTFNEEKDKIYDLEKKLEETKKRGEKLNYSKEEVDKLDKEISSVREKLNALLEAKKKITDHLDEVKKLESSIEYAKHQLQKQRDDFSEEEFCEQLKQVWKSYLNAETDDLEEQVYNKTALLLIEYNILRNLYGKKLEKAREIFAKENDVRYEETVVPIPESEKSKFSFFKKKEQTRIKRKRISEKEDEGRDLYSDLIFARILEIREIINCIWSVDYAVPLAYFKDTYKEIIDALKEYPQEIGYCGGNIILNNKILFDYETAQKLYEELLIPYYIQMGFPVKEEDGKKVPYAFVLGKFDGDNNRLEKDYVITKKAENFYREKGIDWNLLYQFTKPQFDYWQDGEKVRIGWINETMFLSPSEIALLGKYNFIEKNEEILARHVVERDLILKEELKRVATNQEKSHTR